MQPKQGPEPGEAQPDGLGRGILSPGNAEHDGKEAQVDGHNYEGPYQGKQGLNRGQHGPQAHVAEAAGLIDDEAQQVIDHSHRRCGAQNKSAVDQHNFPGLSGALQALGGTGFQLFCIHRDSPFYSRY